MDPKPELILYDIEQTRNSLSEKIGRLENQVKGTVENARNTVEHTFENIKTSVEGSIDTFKRSVSPRIQVDKHPWGMLTASVAVGFLVGNWLVRPSYSVVPDYSSAPTPDPSAPAPVNRATRVKPVEGLTELFGDEIKIVKGVLVSAAIAAVGRQIQKAFPDASNEIAQMVETATEKLKRKTGGSL